MDLRKFLFHSGFPMDKVVYRSNVMSVTVPAYDDRYIDVAHGHGSAFLPLGQYSLDSSFNGAVYDVHTSPTQYGNQIYQTALSVDSTNISFIIRNNTDSQKTFYLRVVGLPIPGSNRDVAQTSNYQRLVFNTNRNYMKLINEGQLTLQNNTTNSIPHTLGYNPRVLVWHADNGVYSMKMWNNRDFTSGSFSGDGFTVDVSSSRVRFRNYPAPFMGNSPVTFCYKIYG